MFIPAWNLSYSEVYNCMIWGMQQIKFNSYFQWRLFNFSLRNKIFYLNFFLEDYSLCSDSSCFCQMKKAQNKSHYKSRYKWSNRSCSLYSKAVDNTFIFTFSKIWGALNNHQLIHNIKTQTVHNSLWDSVLKNIIKGILTKDFYLS